MLATLLQILCEGTPWRSLRASAAKVSGSTLRRAFEHWVYTGLLCKMRAVVWLLHVAQWHRHNHQLNRLALTRQQQAT